MVCPDARENSGKKIHEGFLKCKWWTLVTNWTDGVLSTE